MAGFWRRYAGPLMLVTGLLTGSLAGCGGGSPGGNTRPPDDTHEIDVAVDTLSMRPRGSRVVLFVLRDADDRRPVPNRVVSFEIMEGEEAGGAVLSLDSGVTDASGRVWLQVIAGQQTVFHVRATSDKAAQRMLTVIVDTRPYGPVEVAPELAADLPPNSVQSIIIYLLPAQLCADISPTRPPTGLSMIVGRGETHVFGAVSADDTHAVLGRGRDGTGEVVAEGCVDLPGSTVLEEETIRVPLPLSAPRPSPVGTYVAMSDLMAGDQAPSGAATIVEAFSELTACNNDPGRLWLDCTVDALSPETAADPLDCVPSVADEAAFTGRLAARRGTLSTSTPASRCREPTDGAGRPALEVQIAGMFGAPSDRLIAELKALGTDVSGLLGDVKLTSLMDVTATAAPTRFQVDHALDALQLGPSKVSIDLRALGLPVRVARLIPMSYVGGKVTFQRHGFTLRLGSAARLAFEGHVLPRHSFPSDITAFVPDLFAKASYPDGGVRVTGCTALGALVCPLVSAPGGCIAKACSDGIAALARNLEAVFSRLDGTELDFFIEGEAQVHENDHDGKVDSFGHVTPIDSGGLWSGRLRAGDETQLLIPFTADRLKTE